MDLITASSFNDQALRQVLAQILEQLLRRAGAVGQLQLLKVSKLDEA